MQVTDQQKIDFQNNIENNLKSLIEKRIAPVGWDEESAENNALSMLVKWTDDKLRVAYQLNQLSNHDKQFFDKVITENLSLYKQAYNSGFGRF